MRSLVKPLLSNRWPTRKLNTLIIHNVPSNDSCHVLISSIILYNHKSSFRSVQALSIICGLSALQMGSRHNLLYTQGSSPISVADNLEAVKNLQSSSSSSSCLVCCVPTRDTGRLGKRPILPVEYDEFAVHLEWASEAYLNRYLRREESWLQLWAILVGHWMAPVHLTEYCSMGDWSGPPVQAGLTATLRPGFESTIHHWHRIQWWSWLALGR